MGKKKKLGKNRLDKFYYLAKDQGYRSRAAFKLIQLNKKFNFLGKASALLDLCAAPGSWLQVAAKFMPVSRIIIGVDLAPIKPIPNVITLKQDITTAKCRSEISSHLKGSKAYVVLHDGAPNVGTAWIQDAYSQSELTLYALKLAVEFLAPGGFFITKVFRSSDYNTLLWVFHQLFKKVTATKPNASRSTSAEIFVVCEEYLNPKKIDPKLLDPRSVFKDLDIPKSIVNPFNTKKKVNNQEGYDTVSGLLFKKCSVEQFINTEEPVKILAEFNQIAFEALSEEEDQEQINLFMEHPKTTEEIKLCLKDLKVLNAKDFKSLLKWRMHIRKFAQLEGVEEEPVTEQPVELTKEQEENLLELEIEDKIKQQLRRKKKKEKEREKKITKFRMRQGIQSNMEDEFEAPSESGLFNLRGIRRQATLEELVGKKALEAAAMAESASGGSVSLPTVDGQKEDEERMDKEVGFVNEEEEYVQIIQEKGERAEDVDEEEEHDQKTEYYLDLIYDQYIKANLDYRKRLSQKAKIERKRYEIPEDLSNFEKFAKIKKLEEQLDTYDDEEAPANELLVAPPNEAAAKRAALWFDSELFHNVEGDSDDEEAVNKLLKERQDKIKKRKREELLSSTTKDETNNVLKKLKVDATTSISIVPPTVAKTASPLVAPSRNDDDDEVEAKGKNEEEDEVNGFEEVPVEMIDEEDDPDAYDESERAEMLALGKMLKDPTTRSEVMEKAVNKYMFYDDGKLPTWFMDDENKHNKPEMPVTKEMVQQYKDELKAIDARTIKKVAEAKARKKKQYMQKLEKARTKAKNIAANSDMSEKEKVKQIQKLYKGQLNKVKPQKVYVVGRRKVVSSKIPKGKNVRMVMVDPRLKKDKRGKKASESRSKSRIKKRHTK